MSDSIRLSDSVSLSGGLRGETLAVLGMKGKGKSNTAKVVVEQLASSGTQVVVIDPTDAWWGLPYSRDGGSSGLQVVTFGGHPDRTMLPLEERHADAIVSMILDRGISPILCTRGLSNAAQMRFVSRVLTGLYDGKGERRDKRPLAVAIDECDMFAPKGGTGGAAAACKGAVDDISRRGRVDGFALIAITQRPAALHNDVLSQADTVVCHALALQHDRKAIDEWMSQHDDDPKRAAAFRKSLSSLAPGEAWVWSPGRSVFERTTIDLCRTLDSGKTPDGSDAPAPVAAQAGSVDVDELRALLEPPKAEKKGKKGVIAALRDAAPGTDWAKVEEEMNALRAELEETRKARDTWEANCAEWERAYRELIERIETARRVLNGVRIDNRAGGSDVDPEGVPPERSPPRLDRDRTRASSQPNTPRDNAVHAEPTRPRPTRRGARDSDSPRSGSDPAQRILNAIAWWCTLNIDAPTRVQVALVAGRAPNTGALNSLLSEMQGQGLITYPEPGRVKLTDTGRREAEWPEEIADADGLYYAILDVLKQAESDVFRVLWDAHEDGEDRLTREELAQRLERAANTGAFNSLLGKLNKMGVVTYPAKGCVALADEVSPAHGGVFA